MNLYAMQLQFVHDVARGFNPPQADDLKRSHYNNAQVSIAFHIEGKWL